MLLKLENAYHSSITPNILKQKIDLIRYYSVYIILQPCHKHCDIFPYYYTLCVEIFTTPACLLQPGHKVVTRCLQPSLPTDRQC